MLLTHRTPTPPARLIDRQLRAANRELTPAYRSPLDRLVFATFSQLVRRRILSVEGLRHVSPDRGAFIFVANHS